MSKIIVIFLGTGSQASGLVQKCLDDPEFTPRIVTSNPDSEKAKDLVAKVCTRA
jgi:pyrroline-5-carboxylate reductase